MDHEIILKLMGEVKSLISKGLTSNAVIAYLHNTYYLKVDNPESADYIKNLYSNVEIDINGITQKAKDIITITK